MRACTSAWRYKSLSVKVQMIFAPLVKKENGPTTEVEARIAPNPEGQGEKRKETHEKRKICTEVRMNKSSS